MNDQNSENKSAAVPQVGAKQVEEIYGRWPWVERSVWSARLLQTLENGVKGGKWFSLIDKVGERRNLSAAWFKTAVNKGSGGIDGQSIEQFTSQLGKELDELQRELKESSYQPLAVRRCWIPKPGSKEKRPLGIPAVRDRTVQGALRNVLEPIFERIFAEHSYGFRPGRGCKDALRRVDHANLYLNPLDHLMAARGYAMTRYADDFVVQCRTQAEAQAALELIQNWAKENGLTVHPTKTRIVDASQKGGFDFLGYHFERGMKWPRQKSMDKLRDTIRSRTRRTQGQSMEEIIHRVNPTLRGWFEYFKHSHRTTFSDVDGWVRMRLRSILRQRQGKRGRGRGIDPKQWPNAFFERLGLFSLVKAWRLILQSP